MINSIKSANNSKSANTTLLESISDIVHNNINTTIPAMEIHTTESSNSAIHHTISDFLVQNDITLQQLLDYVKSMKISTNPKILMSLQQHKFKRKKRNAGGRSQILFVMTEQSNILFLKKQKKNQKKGGRGGSSTIRFQRGESEEILRNRTSVLNVMYTK